jgi:cytochrome c-type biogenesis protein CcmH
MNGLKSAVLVLPQRARRPQTDQLDLETCKARLEEIGTRQKLGKLSEAEADAARLALLSQPRSSIRQPEEDGRGTAAALIVPAAIFLFIAGIGAAATYMEGRPGETGFADTGSVSQAHSVPDDEVFARLKAYTRSIGAEETASLGPARTEMPDMNTMIDRLAARLETTPQDLDGWMMLGRSYFHTARYDKAVSAFAKAIALDPNSDDLKRAYEEAKAKASEAPEAAASSLPAETDVKSGTPPE